MPDLIERIYSSEQIHIPPTFPYIMKLYCKAAIRTQPYDLLKWSAAYFRALANGEEPPVKQRVEYPPYDSPSGLTPGYIKILINQFGKDPSTTITAQTLFKKWNDICLQEHLLIQLIALLGASTVVNWVRFVGVCAGFISKNLTQTMILICELFTEEPEGGMATIPYELFIDLYMFLAQLECGPLTDEERATQDEIMVEGDSVADKIREGIYGEEGELAYEELEEALVGLEEEEGEEEEEEQSEEGEKLGEEETSRKEIEAVSDLSEEGRKADDEEVQKEEKGEGAEEEGETVAEGKSQYGDFSEKSSIQESAKSVTSMEGEAPAQAQEEAVMQEVKEPVEEGKEKGAESKIKLKKMKLEDFEESVRQKIEKKLAEDQSYVEDEEKEFQDFSKYISRAADRVDKFTTETMRFKIFKRYLRQDVPGIGPYIETEQVEKVVNFMDFWSHKQEVMVMPRNIRHWMCPPLDKVPTPEP